MPPKLNPEEFLDRLIRNPRGEIILHNILEGLEEKLFDAHVVQELFSQWETEYIQNPSRSTSAMIGALNKVVFAYPYPKPDFRLICQRKPRLSAKQQLMTTVITMKTFKEIFQLEDFRPHYSEGFFPSSDYQEWSKELQKTPEEHRKIRLKQGASIGRKARNNEWLLWCTPKNRLDVLLNGWEDKMADRARDALGLVDKGEGEHLVAVHFSTKVFKHVNNGRPTFMDSGGHSRFKTRADKIVNRRRSAWGHTTDLTHFSYGKKYLDGLPERVARPVDQSALEGAYVGFTSLGKTTTTRGKTPNDNDTCFAMRLRNGRTLSKLKDKMMDIIYDCSGT